METPKADSAAGSAPAKAWSLPVSLAFTAVAIPLCFYLKFGYLDGYAYGCTAFLMLLEVAVEVLPRKAEEAEREKFKPAPRGRFDFLGVIWLLSIPFAPFFGWVIGNTIDVDAANWKWILATRAVLCVVLPVVCVLPLLRYLKRPHVAFGLAVLAVGTTFPVLTGLGSALDVVRGPEWQDVEITGFQDIDFRTGAGTRVKRAKAFVYLGDGRRLTHADKVDLHEGPARVLVLRGIGRIIGVEG